MRHFKKTILVWGSGFASAMLTGCYEEVNPQPAQPQAQTATPTEEGPITSHMNQGGGSALGGAKRSAESTVDRAQQESQRVADEADKLYD